MTRYRLMAKMSEEHIGIPVSRIILMDESSEKTFIEKYKRKGYKDIGFLESFVKPCNLINGFSFDYRDKYKNADEILTKIKWFIDDAEW